VRQSTKTRFTTTRGFHAFLPRRKTLTFVSGIIRRHQISIGSPWRKLNCGQQALLVLAYLRARGETFAEAAAGFGVGSPHQTPSSSCSTT
jgi:hypothetical protein